MAESITFSATIESEEITFEYSEAARGPAGPSTELTSYVDDIESLPDYPDNFPTTPADIGSVGTSKLLGRHGVGTGAAQEIGIDGGLELQGGNLRRSAITGPVTIAAGGTVSAIADGTLTIAMTSGLQTALDSKQASLVSGTNIKTINGNSILGSGDLAGFATLAGNQTFTGQIELSGQSATNSTSAMTRALGDARYAMRWAAALTSGVNSDVNTTTYKTVSEMSFALEVGTYHIDAILIHNGNASYATSGVKDRLDFTGTATATGTLYRVFDNATTSTSVPTSLVSTSPIIESTPTTRSQTTWRKGILTVTAAGTLRVQIAQAAAVAGANTTLAAGSSISIIRLS